MFFLLNINPKAGRVEERWIFDLADVHLLDRLDDAHARLDRDPPCEAGVRPGLRLQVGHLLFEDGLVVQALEQRGRPALPALALRRGDGGQC